MHEGSGEKSLVHQPPTINARNNPSIHLLWTEAFPAPKVLASTQQTHDMKNLTLKTTNRLISPARTTFIASILTLSGCSSNGSDPATVAPLFELSVSRVAMRDGVELHTEVLLPAGATDQMLPTLLLRTPYDLPTLPIGGLAPELEDDEEMDAEEDTEGDDEEADDKDDDEDPVATRAAWQPVLDRGYAIVFQNLRGTQSSGGRNDIFGAEREDGVDTLEWIQQQPWSNGRVGAIGDSAAAFSLHLLAAEQPPGLEATFAQVSCGDIWDSAILPEKRSLKLESYLAFMLGQSLEVGDEHLAGLGISEADIDAAEGDVLAALGALFGDDPGDQFAALTVQPFIDYYGVSTLLPRWKEVLDENRRNELSGYYDTRGASAVPGMHVTLWQDVFVECTLEDFNALANGTAEQRLLVLDGSHYQIDDAATWPYQPMLDWFDRHLKDAPDDAIPTVQYAVQSAVSTTQPSQQLVDADAWPPVTAMERSWFTDSNAVLSEVQPTGPMSFPIMSDPSAPETTLGGRNLVIDSGVFEQPPIDNASAVQTFATTVLDSDMTIAGEIRLETSLLADVPDADLHARLVELTPDNKRILIVAGSQRARYRNGANAPMDLVPGEAASMNVSLGNIAHRVTAGNRLQLELTPSNFPAWDINPQVGGSAFTATEQRAGTLNIGNSRLIIPVLP